MKLTAEELQGILQSTTAEVLEMMLGMESGQGVPVSASNRPGEQVIALVGMAGDWSGTGAISCSAETACTLAGKMLMAEYESVDQDVLDAFGEIANMIVGNIKNVLEARFGPMGLSIPTVLRGANFSMRAVGLEEQATLEFPCDGAGLTVQVSLASAARPHVRAGHAEVAA